jgi:IS30 family transposase
MSYSQITQEDRIIIATLRMQYLSVSYIANFLNRHRSSIYRELARNRCNDGKYRAEKASKKTNGRRRRSRKKPQFRASETKLVIKLLKHKWSPEQISGILKKTGSLSISHQTIYTYIKRNHKLGGDWYKNLRHSGKLRRKKYGAYDSRGVVSGKRGLDERPAAATERSEVGHFEIDTVWGNHPTNTHSILTLVDRKSRYVMIGKLRNRTTAETNRCILKLMRRHEGPFKTITADNGTEFHRFREIEEKTDVKYYFCQPYHSWERGSNENMNGLIRQYLPKGKCMKDLTQRQCDSIATRLNHRPRKTLSYETPEELYV